MIQKLVFNVLCIAFLAASGAADAALMDSTLLNDFDDILFVERGIVGPGTEYDGDHMCDQSHGHNSRTGGGLYVLKDFKSGFPQLVDITEGLAVPSGTNGS